MERPSTTSALGTLIEADFTQSCLVFYMNGRKITLDQPDPEWTLLDFIRSQHGRNGTKLGCGEGGCGACVSRPPGSPSRQGLIVAHRRWSWKAWTNLDIPAN
jgi:hypothetical protein